MSPVKPVRILGISKEWLTSSFTAGGIHLLLFFGGFIAFTQPAQYGVEASTGGVEVSLIAAMPATAEKKTEVSNLQNETIKNADDVVEDVQKKVAKETSSKNSKDEKNYSFVNKTAFSGDGSSPAPGHSPTTFYSPGGGTTDDRPSHLKNPPPSYPRAAVERKQEGLVLLTVLIDKTGHPQKVEVKKSSGHELLDESALKAVRKWKFDPAHVGMILTDSQMDIPIRFVLEDELKRLHSN